MESLTPREHISIFAFATYSIPPLVFLAYLALRWLFATPTLDLSGPNPSHPLWGNLLEVYDDKLTDLYTRWRDAFGGVYRLWGPFGAKQLIIMDPKSVAHVFHSSAYSKSSSQQYFIRLLLGRGLLAIDGSEHKRFKKLLHRSFTPPAVGAAHSAFSEVVRKVKVSWERTVESAESGEAIIDIQHWVNQIALQSFMLGALGSAEVSQDKMVKTMENLTNSTTTLPSTIVQVVRLVWPQVLHLPTERRDAIGATKKELDNITKRLWNEAKEQDVDDVTSKNVLGMLVQAYQAESINDAEAIDHLSTLLFVGIETTSAALAFAFQELSTHKHIQDKLREEVLNTPEDISYDDLLRLPYLDAFTREIMRVDAPVPEIYREVMQDDIIPTSMPCYDAKGQPLDSIPVKKGQVIVLPLLEINRSEAIWGPTSRKFDPERWLDGNLPPAAEAVRSFSHLVTFADGPRTCIGKHYAIAEFKTVVSTLIRHFTFAPRDGDGSNIETFQSIVARPRPEGTQNATLPIRIRAFNG